MKKDNGRICLDIGGIVSSYGGGYCFKIQCNSLDGVKRAKDTIVQVMPRDVFRIHVGLGYHDKS